ncbi:molybdopterin-guanine dinucleotide biosynthesis protein MobB [Thiohalobacter sp. IOR34]|uniref:molybdopterin-guanine dinucleotide biosynthesis protein MobB n=1 Tax=Thiohalobacter sp. IOR34 TaxID=3057176 RepID=UPI0025B25E57|nr:molybdopterin-guanine dinucleotide biosynthesis protein MobB [Thiohalobacter sp. IOR34]WJW74760.1 molybdopterin-guanine dinucleotide biosynthesis protein MobB [Thiohalobacter sp. IOR34]
MSSQLFQQPPVLGFAAFSGTGKTTLLTRLLPQLCERGLRIGMIKHSHHDFDIDIPGKDSYRLRKAGASQMLVASSRRWALITETPGREEASLAEMIGRLDRSTLDLILVEGFRHERFPKIELHRAATGRPLLHPDDDSIIAVASDVALATALPQLDLDDVAAIADFVDRFRLQTLQSGITP